MNCNTTHYRANSSSVPGDPTADGQLDDTYGTGGATYIDAGGYGDNGRFVLVLPDNRVMGVGVGRAAPASPLPAGEQPEADAMIAILTEDGIPDETFGTDGVELLDLGGNADHFWAAAVSPDHTRVAVVGIAGAATSANDDDGVVYLVRIAPDVPTEPVPVPLSLTGHDRFFGVAYDAAGNVYATGQISHDIDAAADYSLLVAKFNSAGQLDASYGNGGVAVKNVAVGGTSRELARGIVVQSTGKVVIAGVAEHDVHAAGVLAADTDIVLLRFNANGTLDTSFSGDGIAWVDLNDGIAGTNSSGAPTLVGGDAQWGLALADGDKLVIHGTQRAEGFMPDGTTPRADADFAVVRLTADGELDDSFGTGGVVTLDLDAAGASARAVSVLPDDSIVATGYLTSTVLGQNTQQPVIYKLTADGDFDATFATQDAWSAPGVWHDFAVAPPLRAEAYGAALQGDHLVTIGYGATNGTGTGSDWISFRFTADGQLDDTYGTGGATYIDAGGYGDNGRFVLVLPDNRVMGVGVGRAAPASPLPAGEQPEADAMIAILTEDGMPDETFGTGGVELLDLGGNADHFWAAAVSPSQTHVVVAGIAGAELNGINDDDAVLYFVRIR